ncbi:MAG: AAA family ATPase [Bacteroidota bacterium]
MSEVKIADGVNLNNLNVAKSYGNLKLRTANQRLEDAKSLPNLKNIFSSFVCEGETTFLFAKSNVGKSVFAVQLAESIATGVPIHEDFANEIGAQKVLYLDCEMNDKQFQKRYSRAWEDCYEFSDNLFFVTIDYEEVDDVPLDSAVLTRINDIVKDTDAKVVVIDNLTYIGSSLEKGDFASKLMKNLKKHKEKRGLTFIVLAHTPKIPYGIPIELEHLAGSSKLGQFIDAAFVVGKSAKDERYRYLKQVKIRMGEMIYHTGNVPVFELEMMGNDNFLGFRFLETFESEYDHLTAPTQKEVEDQVSKIMEARRRGQSFREIAADLCISKTTVKRIYDKNKDKYESI